MNNIFKSIISNKRKEVEAAKAAMPLDKILPRLVQAPPTRSLKAALKRTKGLALIAEIKRASPIKGPLSSKALNVAKLAETYAANGATAISVVTESKFFKGDLGMIEEAKKACGLPIMRKDFIVDPWQMYETRLMKADAVLIIAALFPETRHLKKMIQLANNLSLSPIVEVHSANEFKQVMRCDAELVGINNRDLATFKTDINTSIKLLKGASPERLFISESGILTRDDAKAVFDAGARAILVGEALIRAKDVAALTAELASVGKEGS